jgi:hypothetical protein
MCDASGTPTTHHPLVRRVVRLLGYSQQMLNSLYLYVDAREAILWPFYRNILVPDRFAARFARTLIQ